MAKTKNNVQMPAGIRNKLMAAVAMLMISCVMLITSTYAWFTLSTAPEVTNIDTQVTGNGSLEIALMPEDGNLANITAGKGTSSSVQKVILANRTWGNLVSLTSGEYGLDNVTLMPAKLATTTLSKTNVLNTAKYGTDGRITTVDGTTVLKAYDSEAGKFSKDIYGVRAIGEENTGVNLDKFQTYGYIIDLALRTNASSENGINLILQKEGIQRIYNGDNPSADETTQGSGSTFTVTSDVSADVLKSIRFTFVENMGNTTGEIQVLGTAKLGNSKRENENTVYELNMISLQTTSTGSNGLTMVTPPNTTDDGDYVLTKLQQNVAKQISVVVWLDGAALDSADFATEGTTVKGSLNLQFSTDTTLYPAENTKLKNTAN